MTYGLERMKELPLSLRLIREMHERLLRDGRGAAKNPGEFHTTQKWIGGTRLETPSTCRPRSPSSARHSTPSKSSCTRRRAGCRRS